MDLDYTDGEKAFRSEVRAFIRAALPDDIRAKLTAGKLQTKEDTVRWTRILADKGWSAPGWPAAFGGTGWNAVQQHIFSEEVGLAAAPAPLTFGVNNVGPVIYTYGSDWQKEYFLPRILRLDDWWCQGFSEPGSGSDLASISLRARRDGDDYVLDGQKTWTTGAQHADWMFCLVRTDTTVKKQAGISFLLIDMKTSGISVRPIRLMDGGHEVNDVFFDGVRVPARNLVGEENKGWDYAKFLLREERFHIASVGFSAERLKTIKALVEAEGARLASDPVFRRRITEVELQLKALEVTGLRVIAEETEWLGGRMEAAVSLLKIKASEIQQAITELLFDLAGGQVHRFRDEDELELRAQDAPASWADFVAYAYFNLRKVTIYGGSNEIQRNLIARSLLTD